MVLVLVFCPRELGLFYTVLTAFLFSQTPLPTLSWPRNWPHPRRPPRPRLSLRRSRLAGERRAGINPRVDIGRTVSVPVGLSVFVSFDDTLWSWASWVRDDDVGVFSLFILSRFVIHIFVFAGFRIFHQSHDGAFFRTRPKFLAGDTRGTHERVFHQSTVPIPIEHMFGGRNQFFGDFSAIFATSQGAKPPPRCLCPRLDDRLVVCLRLFVCLRTLVLDILCS